VLETVCTVWPTLLLHLIFDSSLQVGAIIADTESSANRNKYCQGVKQLLLTEPVPATQQQNTRTKYVAIPATCRYSQRSLLNQ
jgi:hypothetical protein